MAATGGIAGVGGGTLVGVAAGSGAITAASNSVIAQTGRNFSGIRNVNWGMVGKSAFVGGIAGAAGAGAGLWASNSSLLINGVNSPSLRTAIASPISSAVGHVAGGTTWGLLEGQGLGQAFYNSFDGIFESMAWGTATGVITTTATSLSNRVNPINGKYIPSKNHQTTVLGHYPEYTDMANQLKANRFEIPQHIWDSMTPQEQFRANLKFLDTAIARGDNIRLATPPRLARPGSFYQMELNYLQSRGYTPTSDGQWLIKK